ncbi:MAG: ATP phosphoribosyltransferase, partial [Methylobacteriaceae bacterium]|nr:ATP phosphoribosyltransferase [Methylobacteriaceae bacterium]
MSAGNGAGAALVLAVPSKGRLQDNANAFFARAGLDVVRGRGVRDYRGMLKGVENVEIAFLSAAEITTQLAAGSIHMGITGEDLVRETIADADERVELLAPLGFGSANVVVAVPRAWIDVRNMADLEDVASAFRVKRGQRMRVATKYVNLTRRFFAANDIGDYRVVESLGATEGAPAAGQAELIVDITTTGATLRANALKVLDDGTILRSQANLAASVKAAWSDGQKAAARALLSRIAAEEDARQAREMRAVIDKPAEPIAAAAAERFGAQLVGTSGGTLHLLVPHAQAATLADWLIAEGAETVTVAALEFVFRGRNALYE